MAYVNQELKQRIAKQITPILKKYGLKGTLAVEHHMTLVLNISAGQIDFIGNTNEMADNDNSGGRKYYEKDYIQVNEFHLARHFSGVALECLQECNTALNDGNFNKSDITTDYFHVGWYTQINIGRYDRPYQLKAA